MNTTSPLGSVLIATVVVSLAGCAGTRSAPSDQPTGEGMLASARHAGAHPAATPAASVHAAKAEDEAKAQEKALKRANLDRQLSVERQKLDRARQEVENQEVSGRGSVEKSAAERELAQARLRTFDEKEAPNRLGKARLDLQQAKDNLDEAKEELDQLEMMYKEENLADKTREIVIRRGKRRLDRAGERLALQQRELETLEGNTLPHERAKLALELEEKTRELDRARRAADSSLLEKRIAVMSAEAEVARIEAELGSLTGPAPK